MTTQIIETFDAVSIKKLSFKFKGETSAIIADCVGALSGETEIQEIVKKCGSSEIKKMSKPIKLTLTITAHVPLSVYREFYGLKHNEATKKGIYSYGPSAQSKAFSLGAEIYDDFEDNSKLLAFLNCSSATGLTFSIENGGDEVAALELEASVSVDELGEYYHEAIVGELETDLTDEWMSNLTAETIKIAVEQESVVGKTKVGEKIKELN